MTRHHTTLISIARRLRPDPQRFAAAAAVQDPNLLLQLQAARTHETRPSSGASRRALTGETGAALLVAGAVAAALLWSNSPWHASYESFWNAPIALTVGPWTLGADLRTWIDEGLMTLFFLVVGLEAKHERDLGELRERRRLTVPMLAGLAGIAASVAVYVAVTASGAGAGAGGWGVAVSTDTALALGALTIAVGRRADRAGVGFTVSLLIASRAFDGAALDQAKLGILVTAMLAPMLAAATLARPRSGTRLALTSPGVA